MRKATLLLLVLTACGQPVTHVIEPSDPPVSSPAPTPELTPHVGTLQEMQPAAYHKVLTSSGGASWYRGRGVGPMTTAHKTLPMGARIEVTYRGRSIIVVVTDRGPFVRGRVLDLSADAFAKLAPLGRGVIEVSYRVL